MSDDPERLLAEALRAQARNAPPAQAGSSYPEPPVVETPGGYGLLSGAGEGSLERERAALEAQGAGRADEPEPARPRREPEPRPFPLPWILLLAVALGLASGSLVGLLTLL
ncbi:hypothetical protein ACFS2C_25300 [Prauserella oleivorans]|uniref:Uncharacterized protein n=1 Tax=Prauserella oleivorans TaxID=1478153 RepID=A0ABW5WFV0_9PSEU